MARLTEDQLISRFFAPLATLPGARGLTDDAATLDVPAGQHLVVTADALVAGVHFLTGDEADLVARKALRVNLSDLAAKGASPYAYSLCIALPEGCTDAWLALFADGLKRDGDAFGLALLGGDTVKTPGPLTIAVTAFGLAPSRDIPRRDGARPGDILYVSGTIGDAALGLQVHTGRGHFTSLLDDRHLEWLRHRYLLPQPRSALAPAVLAHASASMDISDGLVGDLAKLLRASGASAEIDLADIPLSTAARAAVSAGPDTLETALTGGDDYEILCAVKPAEAAAFEEAGRASGVTVTRIGTVTDGTHATHFRAANGEAVSFEKASFSHF